MLINDIIVPSSMTMWLISLFCVVPLYQLTQFRRLQCLIKLLLVFAVCYCVLHMTINQPITACTNFYLQLLAADCQAWLMRNSHSAVCQWQLILADWHAVGLWTAADNVEHCLSFVPHGHFISHCRSLHCDDTHTYMDSDILATWPTFDLSSSSVPRELHVTLVTTGVLHSWVSTATDRRTTDSVQMTCPLLLQLLPSVVQTLLLASQMCAVMDDDRKLRQQEFQEKRELLEFTESQLNQLTYEIKEEIRQHSEEVERKVSRLLMLLTCLLLCVVSAAGVIFYWLLRLFSKLRTSVYEEFQWVWLFVDSRPSKMLLLHFFCSFECLLWY